MAFLAVAALTLAAPPASADRLPVEGSLVAHGPAILQGTQSLQAEAAAILLGASDNDRFNLEAPGARILLVNQPTTRLVTPAGPFTEEPMEQEILDERPLASLAFNGRGLDVPTDVRILPSLGDLGIDLSASRRLDVSPRSPVKDGDDAFAEALHVAGHATRPADGGFVTAQDLGGLAWSAPFALLAMGGVATLDDGTVWTTGRWLNESRSVVDPLTGSGSAVYDNRMLVVLGREGAIAWPAGSEGWGVVVATLQGRVSGDVVWMAADADVRAGGEPIPPDSRLFQVKGDLELSANFGDPARWTLAGEAEFVGIDGKPSWTSTAATAGAVAVTLAAVAAWLGRGGLAAFVAKASPRLRKVGPLDSPGRKRVLGAIHAAQPVGVDGLRRATGMTRTALAYHLGVLLAYDVIQTRPGAGQRSATYMLNSGSLAFRVFGEIGVEAEGDDGPGTLAAQALAVTNSHPIRRELYAAIRDHGPVDFQRINALRDKEGLVPLPQSTATHHLQMLVRSGAIAQGQVGRSRTYRPLLDDREVRIEQYRRLLGQERGLDLVRRLADGPQPLAQLTRGDRAERRRLDRLVALGVVRFDPGASRYDLAGFLRPWAHRL